MVSASTGNHGQSMAFACRVHGVPCRIFVPVGNNPDKMAAMRALGATVVEYGRDFDEAREHVEELAPREGWRYVHSANEPHLIAGVGTLALEIFDELPDVDYIFVPVGGGSGAAGCCIVRTGRGSRAKVDRRAGVRRADAFARSWRGPARVTTERGDDVCRRHRDADDLRSDVLDILKSAARRCRDARGGGAQGRRPRGAAADAQPR